MKMQMTIVFFQFEGPSVPLPVVGKISVGGYEYSRERMEMKPTEQGQLQNKVKVTAHQ